jgi:putative transposase
MLKQMQKIIEETCEQMLCKLLEFNGDNDHIHLMIHVHPKLAISNLVGKLKGKTSYFMHKIHPTHVKKYLWGNRFWSPSYCVVSCGGAPLDVVKKYIDNQRAPTLEKHIKKSKALTRS